MPDAIDQICTDLEIKVIPTHQTRLAMETKAGQTMRAILRSHGQGHLILVLRTIVESEGNGLGLTAPIMWAVSDVLKAHAAWGDRGLAWIEAFDQIDLAGLYRVAKANKKACPPRAAIATLLHMRLAPLFDPPAKVSTRRPYNHSRTTPRYTEMEAA